MKKNVIWWVGVKNPQLNEKYGNGTLLKFNEQ